MLKAGGPLPKGGGGMGHDWKHLLRVALCAALLVLLLLVFPVMAR